MTASSEPNLPSPPSDRSGTALPRHLPSDAATTRITMGEANMRSLTAGLALCLVAAPALAASPKIESAIRVYKAVAANPQKLRTFCEMSKVIEKMGDKEDAALEAQIDRLMGQLGQDFQTAWEAGDGVDENSPDGKALYAAIDELEDKCPR
jgi:CMP-N-acetylneuraminic acid synthetase